MLCALSVSGVLDLRFCDETAFNLMPNIPYGWTPVSQQQGIEARKGGNLNVFGLLNIHTGSLNSYITTGRVDSDQVIEWLDDFANLITKTTVLIMDNAPWHKSKKVTGKIKEWQDKGLYIYFIPPYSPHLNLIEILWRMMKYRWLRPQDFRNKESLHNRIKFILQYYDKPEFTIQYEV